MSKYILTWKIIPILLAILAIAADNTTTWYCLTHYPEMTYEANPFADATHAYYGLMIANLGNALVSVVMVLAFGANLWCEDEEWLFGVSRWWFSLGVVLLVFLIRAAAGINNYLIYAAMPPLI